MNRRDFVKSSVLATTAVGLMGSDVLAQAGKPVNRLPQWRGFNLLDFFMANPAQAYKFTTEQQLKWIRDWGFDFVRIPVAYPFYLDIDHSKKITPDQVYKFSNKRIEQIEGIIQLAHKQGLHVSLNLHRAPGFCVNAGFEEPYNLWKDDEAQKAFASHWEMWAKRFKSTSPSKISFDLLNEPCIRENMNDQLGDRTIIPGQLYKRVAAEAVKSIRSVNPDFIIVADGNNVGSDVTPELVDLKIGQSCRGYFPSIISHYKAPWAMKDVNNLPTPVWPGKVGDQDLNRKMLEEYYKPWIDLVKSGTGVHCGECGCWNKTPHDVFLSWFGDVLDILRQNSIGFSLWEFDGDFGILNSRRADVDYTDWYGQKLDSKLLKLLQRNA